MMTIQELAASPEGAKQRRYIAAQMFLAFVGLALGGLFGIFQALDRLGYNAYAEGAAANSLGIESYYQGLTIHGVALAIVFTFTFSNAFLQWAVARGFGRPLASTGLVKLSFWLSLTGVVLAATMMLLNEATVLYTMYAPLAAHWLYYLGAALLVVSTWVVLLNQLLSLKAWKKDNRGEKIPLLSYVSIMTYLMWFLASLGIAAEVLGLLIPWALGLTDGIDPLMSRTLFWFSGHPIVYFWLLPAYVSWYMMVPKKAEGRLFSDPVVRIVFIMFLLLSTPVGLHHQFTDPGVDAGLKFMQGMFTFAVFFPSTVTAFTLMAAFEDGGRRKGAKGILSWIKKMPWGDASASAQILAMISFLFGGASGLINASYTVNLVIHNTSFVPGHFHMTVGSAVALSFMGIAYWFVPHLTGKRLYSNKLAVVQGWLYFAGVMIFGRGLMASGLEGQPRRVPIAQATYARPEWLAGDAMGGIGGLMMVLAGLLFFYILIRTLLTSKPATEAELDMPLSDTMRGADQSPAIFDRIGFWFLIAVALVLIAYVPALINIGYDGLSPTWRVW